MEKAEQETEYGRSRISRYVSGVSSPSAARITLSAQELEHIDKDEDCCCMQYAVIPFYSLAEGES